MTTITTCYLIRPVQTGDSRISFLRDYPKPIIVKPK